jgi:parvulin-like peptidyl-prolyl isomerase
MSSKLYVGSGIKTVVVAAALFAFVAGGAQAEVIEQILIKVNGEVFTKSDLEARQILRLREMQEQVKDNKDLQKMLDEITPAILVDAVDEMLIVQRGKELGYTLTDTQFESILKDIRTNNKLENEEDFEAALKQEGLTKADLRKNLERQMMVQRVQQSEIVNRVAMTEDEARAYYDAHQAEFTTPAAVTLREILISPPADSRGVNVAADEAAQARADAIRARALAGEGFDKLAADFSDSASRANGGLIGPINLDDLSADLRKVIEAMKIGEISELLRTPRGYQILKLETLTPKRTLAFEPAREQIAERILAGKREREFQKYSEKLRAQAIIEWKNPDIKKAYDDGLQRQATLASTREATPAR